MTIRVLLTGAGAPGTPGTIWALRNNPDGESVYVIGTDINRQAMGRHLCDEFTWSLPPESMDYRSRMWDIVARKEIDVVIPQCTRELPVLANWQRSLVMVSPINAIRLAQSKRWIMEHVGESYRPVIAGGDYVAKPDTESGKRGFVDLRGMTVMEHLPGTEYSVDCFDQTAVVRRRDEVCGGVSAVTEVVEMPDIGSAALRLGQDMGLTTCYGVQFKEDSRGNPKIIDCNPRVMGTMVCSALAGVPLVWASVCRVLGRKEPELGHPTIGTRFVRTRGGLGYIDGKIVHV